MILNYKNFIYEKLGINSDVITLVKFLENKINKKDIVIDTIDLKLSFKINKISIKFISHDKIAGGFNMSRSKLTKNGYNIYLLINSKTNIKNTLYHELIHVIKYQNLTHKNLKMFSPVSYYHDQRFEKLLFMLYYSDESEINAKVSEIYSEIETEITENQSINKKDIFTNFINNLSFRYEDNPQMMIEYNIHEDLNGISSKDILNFFNYIIEVTNIKKNQNKFVRIIKTIKLILFNKNDSNISQEQIMKRTQSHINNQGKKMKKKIDKLYSLF